MASMPRNEREQRRGDEQKKKRKQGKRCDEVMQPKERSGEESVRERKQGAEEKE